MITEVEAKNKQLLEMRNQLKVKDEALRALDERGLTIHILIDKIRRMNEHFSKEKTKLNTGHQHDLSKLYSAIDQLQNSLRRVLFEESKGVQFKTRSGTALKADWSNRTAVTKGASGETGPVQTGSSPASQRPTGSTRPTTGRGMFGTHRSSLGAPSLPLADLAAARTSQAVRPKAGYLSLV